MGRKAAPPRPYSPAAALNTAEALFAGTHSLHRLRPRARRALAAAVALRSAAPGHLSADRALAPRPGLTRFERLLLTAVLNNLSPSEAFAQPPPDLNSQVQSQSEILSALLRLAEILDGFGPSAARLEAIVIAPKHVTLQLGGHRAQAAALAARAARRPWRLALHTGLAFQVDGPTTSDLERLAASPLQPTTPLFETIQGSLAAASLEWERALAQCAPDHPMAPAATLTATVRLRQLLTVFRPHLRHRGTQRLRSSLTPVRKALQQAAAAQAVADDVAAFQASQSAETARQLAGLRESAAAAAQHARQALSERLAGPAIRDLPAAVRAFIGDLPLRQAAEGVTAEAAPGWLTSAADHLERRQLTYSAAHPASRRRVAHSVQRFTALLQILAPTLGQTSGARALVEDLNHLAACLEDLGRLESVEHTVAAYLDAWAERQGRRKAPQMHGVEAVLDYRQARRADRTRQMRALAEAWKPLRGRKLAHRLSAILAASALPSA